MNKRQVTFWSVCENWLEPYYESEIHAQSGVFNERRRRMRNEHRSKLLMTAPERSSHGEGSTKVILVVVVEVDDQHRNEIPTVTEKGAERRA